MCIYKNSRRQPIPKSLSLFIIRFKRGGEQSVVCMLRSEGHFQKRSSRSTQTHGVRARIANCEVNSPKMNSSRLPGEGHLSAKPTTRPPRRSKEDMYAQVRRLGWAGHSPLSADDEKGISQVGHPLAANDLRAMTVFVFSETPHRL